ncbi:hypothetical protein [Corynebacterium sp.]|uniref:hypothetical protein n=1 Tax=Corynebacterium sp. TaxID=1720 RepID=UPI0026DA7CD4|nr:hypothetical protein [Corynebacterium sp.]MDO5031909.1 hypothetical protein [Corynebacterium sp.]
MKIGRVSAGTAAVVMALSGLFAPVAAASEHGAGSVDSATTDIAGGNRFSKEKVLAVGADGIVRKIVTKDNGEGGDNTLANKLELAKGDTVEISDDAQVATVRQADGSVLGEFVAPVMNVGGSEVQGQFAYEDGNLLTTFKDDVFVPYGCWQGTTAKWTWRVAAGLACGALGVVSVPGGFACGLGAAGAEDAMDIDGHAC